MACGARIVRLEICSVNISAQKLYRNAGYAAIQRLTRYYANSDEGLLDGEVADVA